jgi:hypothetical protein
LKIIRLKGDRPTPADRDRTAIAPKLEPGENADSWCVAIAQPETVLKPSPPVSSDRRDCNVYRWRNKNPFENLLNLYFADLSILEKA